MVNFWAIGVIASNIHSFSNIRRWIKYDYTPNHVYLLCWTQHTHVCNARSGLLFLFFCQWLDHHINDCHNISSIWYIIIIIIIIIQFKLHLLFITNKSIWQATSTREECVARPVVPPCNVSISIIIIIIILMYCKGIFGCIDSFGSNTTKKSVLTVYK